MSGRFLRDSEQRAVLYQAAQGRCQSCGVELEDGWHADHIVPYSVSPRTNVFEMQALCGPCNSRKGNGMIGQVKLDSMREGQRLAVNTIVSRIQARESHTAVVLPTRYGKTDVMRVSGAILQEMGAVSRSLVLVPNQYLRSQFIWGQKFTEAAQRYNLPSERITTYEAERRPSMPFPRGSAAFTAMTTQMAVQNVGLLTSWVEYEKKKRGAPPVVFVDEAHTGSEDNRWGECVSMLSDAGAFVVLLTATPFRSDERRIPGFELETVGVREAVRRKRRGDALDVFEGRETVYKLKAHHETTFGDAWATEPPVLCHIARLPFDIDLERIDAVTGEMKGETRLSMIPRDRARRVLSEELRKPAVIEDACKLLVRRLKGRQMHARETAAIVFVGNDQPDDPIGNQHAMDVMSELRRQDSDLYVRIATSADSEAAGVIESFVDGVGDVLVVKQMAGLGMDADRLKVCLDLSSIRTQGAFIQRITRIATIWDRREKTGLDWDVGKVADYITPDDIRAADLYQAFIRDEGGHASVAELKHVATTDSDGQDSRQIPDRDIAVQVTHADFIQDSHHLEAPGNALDALERVFSELPGINQMYTMPEVYRGLESAGLIDIAKEVNGHTPEPTPSVAPTPVYRNVNEEQKALRQELNELHRKIVWLKVDKNATKDEKERVRQTVWTEHKMAVGVGARTSLQDIPETTTLRQMKLNMERELRNLEARTRTDQKELRW